MNLAALSMITLSLGLAEPSASDVISTKSRVHQLQIDYKEEQRKQIQRVELCVSRDQGAVWTVADAVTPDKDHLLLKAPADGIYWVKMVIVFRDGTREPSDVLRMQPDFKMLIDATPPVVRVNATRVGEEVVVDWTIEEQHPNEAATQVVYRGSGPDGGEWQPVPPGSILKRTAKFKPTMPGPIVVQVVAQDQAGNPGAGAKEVAGGPVTNTAAYTPRLADPVMPTGGIDAVSPSMTGPAAPMFPPSASTTPAAPAMSSPNGPLPPPVLDQVPPSSPSPGLQNNPAVIPAPNLAPAPAAPIPAPTMPAVTPTPEANLNIGVPSNPFPPAPAEEPSQQQLPVVSASGGPNTFAPLPVTDASAPRPAPNWSSSATTVSATEATPPAPSVQTINFLRFDLQYQIDNGPSGISRVDLYVSRDNGRQWVKWSEHDGRQQPLKVQLDTTFNQQREGEYGLRLVPVSGAGLSEGAPAPGTPPELRVNVDLTPPLIRPFMPTADPNVRNTLTLLWEATDKNFAANPIAIDWSEAPTGPWKSVHDPEPAASNGLPLPVAGTAPAPVSTTANRLPNTGSYAWQLPASMATHKVYLKFTAWDAAGNKSEVVTQSPVMVDLVKPRARIQGISTPSIPAR